MAPVGATEQDVIAHVGPPTETYRRGEERRVGGWTKSSRKIENHLAAWGFHLPAPYLSGYMWYAYVDDRGQVTCSFVGIS